jgi:[protein-PII] uridylyltransferase
MVDIATRDTKGLLARIAGVLAERGLDIVTADLATWPDGAVLDSFMVRSSARPSAEMLVFDLERSLRAGLPEPRRLGREGGASLRLDLDNDAHPWHSVVTLSGPDQPGLLRTVAAAMAKANVRVHHARVSTVDGGVADRFEVSDRHGRKISSHALERVRALLV